VPLDAPLSQADLPDFFVAIPGRIRNDFSAMSPFKCPGCGREAQFVPNPEGKEACPHCGSLPARPARSTKFNWLIFLGVLLAPAIFALGGALGKIDGLAVGSPLVGSGIAGLLCGIYLARRIGRTSSARVWLGFVFVGVFGCVSFVLSFFGCVLGGFKMNMR
jgi:hypothetical protein